LPLSTNYWQGLPSSPTCSPPLCSTHRN